MNRTPDNRENSRARRHPSNVRHTQNPVNSQRAQNPAYNFHAGSSHTVNQARNTMQNGNPHVSRPASSGRTPQRTVTSLTSSQQQKIARRENKALEEARKEREWQKEVVRTKSGPDLVMLAIICILLALGSAMVFSASYPLALKEQRPSNYYLKKQFEFLLLGGGLMTFIMFLPAGIFRGFKIGKLNVNVPKCAFTVSLLLLMYALVAGIAEGVTMRWVSLGFFNLQPSELMKISMILLLAWYTEKYEKEITTPLPDVGKRSIKYNIVWPLIICIVGCGFILLGRHLSGTIITALIAFFMLIIGGIEMKGFLTAAIPLAGSAVGLFLIAFPYARQRIETMFDKNADTLDEAWQTTQSVYAIGSGGLAGVGLGESRQKYSYLSNAHTDFIFSIWCEELGFVCAVLLIALFMVFIWRGYTIAVRAPDKFTMMTAFGITTHVGIQAFLNMAVATDLIPNTGITLPFFSYGGSSLMVLMIEMGVLLSISKRSYKRKSDMERDSIEEKYGLR